MVPNKTLVLPLPLQLGTVEHELEQGQYILFLKVPVWRLDNAKTWNNNAKKRDTHRFVYKLELTCTFSAKKWEY